jgi:hypothetical protein
MILGYRRLGVGPTGPNSPIEECYGFFPKLKYHQQSFHAIEYFTYVLTFQIDEFM